MPDLEIIEIEPGTFAVSGLGQYQPHDPDLPGFVPMDNTRAEEVGQAMRAALAEVSG